MSKYLNEDTRHCDLHKATVRNDDEQHASYEALSSVKEMSTILNTSVDDV